MRGVSALLLFLLASTGGRSAAPAPPPVMATCVFSNPGFAGKCVEKVEVGQGGSPQQACASILACLNDTRCLKTYCQATTIREGWKLESAK
jgi:hypothetical protein